MGTVPMAERQDMKTLNADIRTGNFKPVYLLYGDEAFLKRGYKKSFKDAVAGGDSMNSSFFEGKEISEDQVIDVADTLPFFAERRLVMVEDSGWFKGGAEKLPDYIARIPDTTVMVFVETAVDKRNRLYKAVQKKGHIVELKPFEGASLDRWAAKYLLANGKNITQSTMDRFLEYVGSDMENIRNELDKLISYVGDRSVIDARDVDTVTTVTLQNRVFEMVGAITARRTGQAMKMLDDLIRMKESPMGILFLIARQFDQLLMVKELSLAGKNKGEIASAVKVPPFIAGRMMGQVKNTPSKVLLQNVRRCVELEEAVKTGNMKDRMAVELLIAELARV